MSVGTTTSALSFRCATWTRQQGVDPVGSALTCDTLVLIETPPPWPRDVGEIPVFAELLQRRLDRTRLLAVLPMDERLGADRDPRAGVGVTVWRREDSSRLRGTDHTVARDRLAEGILQILGVDPDAGSGSDSGRPTGGRMMPDDTARAAPAEVLICGHGQRDRCCGRLGVRLQRDVVSAWPGVRIRRCSHTGGHRYAPTGVTLPDGRMWGFLDTEVLDGVLGRNLQRVRIRDHYRGNVALDQWAQVAERELFEQYGWGWLDHTLTSSCTEVAGDGRAATVELAWTGPTGRGSATATVAVVRDVPILICGEAPELAEKTSPELALRSITICL